MRHDSSKITATLIAQHGVHGALDAVRDEIADAHARKDLYRLSLLREVKRKLQAILDSAEAQEEPSP